MSDVSFRDRISALAAKEAADGRRDPERMGDAIEALAGALALIVAAATHGNSEGMSTLLEGATAYAFERSEDMAKVARMIR